MEDYINNFKKFDRTIVYDFRLGDGGIGDYLKFFMIILTKCMCNNVKIYHKINNIEIANRYNWGIESNYRKADQQPEGVLEG